MKKIFLRVLCCAFINAMTEPSLIAQDSGMTAQPLWINKRNDVYKKLTEDVLSYNVLLKKDILNALIDLGDDFFNQSDEEINQFFKAVIAFSPNNQFGSDRAEIIKKFKGINPKILRLSTQLTEGLKYEKVYVLNALIDLGDDFFNQSDEEINQFFKVVIAFSQNSQFGFDRAKIIKKLKGLNPKILRLSTQLTEGLKYEKEYVLNALIDLGEDFFNKSDKDIEEFIKIVLVSSPNEQSGLGRKMIMNKLKDIINDLDPKLYHPFRIISASENWTDNEKKIIVSFLQKLKNPTVFVNFFNRMRIRNINVLMPIFVHSKTDFFDDQKNIHEYEAFFKNHINLESINQGFEFSKFLLAYFELCKQPDLLEKLITLAESLNKKAYQDLPKSKALGQIIAIKNTRMGRSDENAPLANDVDEENYLIEEENTFSQNENLGLYIKQYFEQEKCPFDGLFEYAIGCSVPTEDVKGIIINNYGGFGGIDFNEPAMIGNENLIRDGFMVIDLQTRDNWQELHQADQFETKQGKELLGDTMIQLLLFVKAVKERYPNKPVFFMSGSFGGVRGALMNLILSNKDDLNNLFKSEFVDVANKLERFFKSYPDISTDYIKGYALHDGYYDSFWSMNAIKKYHVTNPMLLLQNFDDERVTADQTFIFYEKLKNDQTPLKHLSIHITPQGAKTALQADNIDENPSDLSSSEGHFKPEIEKYRKEYDAKIDEFLNNIIHERNVSDRDFYKTRINQVRVDHLKNAWGNDTDKTPAQLYRLYYANLHEESEQDKISVTDRLSKTFSQYAKYTAKEGENPVQTYQTLINNYGVWLMAKILKKNADTKFAVANFIYKNKHKLPDLQKAPLSPDQPASPIKQIDLQSFESFIVAEDARDFLKTQPDSLTLLRRAKALSIYITKKLLKFLLTHPEPLTIEHVEEFWNIKNLPTDHPLSLVARSLSLINLEINIHKDKILDVLKNALRWNPISVLFNLHEKKLNAEEYNDIIDKILLQNEDERMNLLHHLSTLLPANNPNDILEWLITIPKQMRLNVKNNYLRALTLLNMKIIDKQKIACFLITVDPSILNALTLDSQPEKFVTDIREMMQRNKNEWLTFFNKRYGKIGPYLSNDRTKEHLIKTAKQLKAGNVINTIDKNEVLITIQNDTDSVQKISVDFLGEDRFGQFSAEPKFNELIAHPHKSVDVKISDLSDEFYSPTAALDQLAILSAKINLKGKEILAPKGSVVRINKNDQGEDISLHS